MECSFPSANGWSKTVFDYSLFTITLALPVAYFLLTDNHLERFYYPLAWTAKLSVTLQLCESSVYLLYLPVDFQQLDAVYNCGQLLFSRLHAIVSIFGEMHLVYFLTKALGLGTQSISLGRGVALTLPQTLVIALFASLSTFVACIFHRSSFGMARNIWTIALAALQYQQIRAATLKHDNDACLIQPKDATVRLFGKLTAIQVFSATVCLVQRTVYRPLYPENIVRFNNARLVVDYISVYIFYWKVLLVQEKANVEVTTVDGEA